MSQRLVRKLCDDCKQPIPADEASQALLEVDSAVTIYHAKGCEKCFDQGYRGRIGLYELILIDEDVKTLIHSQVGEQAMEQHVRKTTPSLRQDGMKKVIAGNTTIEEVLRVSHG